MTRIAACGVAAFITFATLSPIEWRPVVTDLGLEHVAAFAVLSALLGLAYPRRLILMVALVAVAAGVLEVLQHFVPGRHGRLVDVEVKYLGAMIGFVFASVANVALHRRV